MLNLHLKIKNNSAKYNDERILKFLIVENKIPDALLFSRKRTFNYIKKNVIYIFVFMYQLLHNVEVKNLKGNINYENTF